MSVIQTLKIIRAKYFWQPLAIWYSFSMATTLCTAHPTTLRSAGWACRSSAQTLHITHGDWTIHGAERKTSGWVEWARLAYLLPFSVDSTEHLNVLNVNMQGRSKLVTGCFDSICAFLNEFNLAHFPCLKSLPVNLSITRIWIHTRTFIQG